MPSSKNPPPDASGLMASLAKEAVATQLIFDLQFVRDVRQWQELAGHYRTVLPFGGEALEPQRTVLSHFEATARVSIERSKSAEGGLQLSAVNAATDLLYAKRYQSREVDSVFSVEVTAVPLSENVLKSTPLPQP